MTAEAEIEKTIKTLKNNKASDGCGLTEYEVWREEGRGVCRGCPECNIPA